MFGLVWIFSLLIEFIMGIVKVIFIAIGFIMLLIAILSSNDKGFKPFYAILGILIVGGGLSASLEHDDAWSWVITGAKGFSEVGTLVMIGGLILIVHLISNFSSSESQKKENKKKKRTCKIRDRKPIKYRISTIYNRVPYNVELTIPEDCKKNTCIKEKKYSKYISYVIGILIGITPIIMNFYSDGYKKWSIYLIILFLGPLLLIFIIFLLKKNRHLLFGIIIPYVVLFLYFFIINTQEEQNKIKALSVASKEKNYKKCVQLLEKYKNKYNDPDSQGYNSLHYALVNKDENLIKLLVENKIYLRTKDDLNSYDFFSFSQNTKNIIVNDLEILWEGSPHKLIFKELNETKKYQKELIEKYYKNGMDINIKSESSRDNLLRSVVFSNVSDDEKMRSFDFLIEHGIDMNRYNTYLKENILYELIYRHDLIDTAKVIKYGDYLVGKGLNINSINYKGENLLHIAFEHKNKEVIDFLIKNMVNLEQKDVEGEIPLLKVINGSKISIQEIKNYLNYYYENNTNPFIVNKYGKNVIDYIDDYNKRNENIQEKKEIEEFKNELIKSLKNKNGDKE